MAVQQGYLIIDIGTGNVRVAVTDQAGSVLALERDTMLYVKDESYPDALHFDPHELWGRIQAMTRKALQQLPDVSILAITASSQREGIVLLDAAGNSLIGLSNHDHRGREWEDMIEDKHHVYALTGRYPSSLFSAFKVIGIKHRRPDIYRQFAKMLSISDWAQYQFCGVENYEPAQASETLLYDVKKGAWSSHLCQLFGIDEAVLPPLRGAGTVLGPVLHACAESLHIPAAVVVVGGADTQLAVKSTMPSLDDIVIVSGTTTPVVKITDRYVTDSEERTWTNRHVDSDHFILEANAGVTGLNYQRLKEIFYPNESYQVIEKELAALPRSQCVASLGSLVAEEKSPLTKGGFVFSTPVSHELTRAGFVHATLWDIACSIRENLDVLCSVSGNSPDFVWACGGGFQSSLLRQFTANLTGKKIRIREGYQQSSVTGAALVCNEALGVQTALDMPVEEVVPQYNREQDAALYKEWKEARARFRQSMMEDSV